MKSKKRFSIKAQIRAEKEKERYIATAIFSTLILITIILSAYLGSYPNNPQIQTANSESSQPKAAIVDQLSLTFPNKTFIETATNILEQANYKVDYYPGEKITVEFYRNLPTHEYKVIILRVHSTTGGRRTVALFTSELYSRSKYVYEQLSDRLHQVKYHSNDQNGFFGILPNFVMSSMNGMFQDTVIIMMGCEGIMNTKMAEAFIKKGAKAYIGWNTSVSVSHTDAATTILLQHLITKKQTIQQAVENTMKIIGPDPTYKSVLAYYPPTTADETV